MESNVRHSERCKKCKQVFKKCLDQIFGIVEENYKFKIGTIPSDFKNSDLYMVLTEIYDSLKHHRGHEEFVRTSTLPRCDLYIPSERVIIEFDESQHFSIPRKISLTNYPDSLTLGYNKDKWINLCERIHASDNDPKCIFRDEQRAWYDTLRDFLPQIVGLNPTKRVFAKDYIWCELNPDNQKDIDTFIKILNL